MKIRIGEVLKWCASSLADGSFATEKYIENFFMVFFVLGKGCPVSITKCISRCTEIYPLQSKFMFCVKRLEIIYSA